MSLTLDNYIKAVKIFEQDDEELNKWVKVISLLENIDARSIPLRDLNGYINYYTEELNIETLETEEIHKFYFNDELYLVDTTIYTANVALFADYNTKIKRYKGVDQIKQVLSLLIYKEDEAEEYTYQRSQTNLQRIGEFELKTCIGITRFFFQLLKNYTELSQIYLVEQEMRTEIQKIIQEL